MNDSSTSLSSSDEEMLQIAETNVSISEIDAGTSRGSGAVGGNKTRLHHDPFTRALSLGPSSTTYDDIISRAHVRTTRFFDDDELDRLQFQFAQRKAQQQQVAATVSKPDFVRIKHGGKNASSAAGASKGQESDGYSEEDDDDEGDVADEYAFDKLPVNNSSLTASPARTSPQMSSAHFDSFTMSIPSFPKNGTGLPMIYPGPQHINIVPRDPEGLHHGGASLIPQMILRDQRQYTSPHLLLNRVIYDCIDPSPLHAQSSQSQMQFSFVGGGPGGTPSSLSSSSSSSMQPSIKLKPYYIPQSEQDTTLVFESRFESGNLRRAVQVYEYEYDLVLKFDVNTRGHTQWFYFSVQNIRRGVKYKFNIVNLMKPDSLYNEGMKPLVYSERDARQKSRGWVRGGFDICYYQNQIKRKNSFFYTFTWSYVFENEGDTYYFAYCYPYTYSNLQNYLTNLERDPIRRKLFRRRTLCQTLAGNNCDLLTITSFSCDPQALQNRKGVVISARVHPGESNSSWMMKGVIDYLTGPSLDAQILRDNFVFKIVPMLNPDGVINGNYRSGLAGVDLNRKWDDPSKKLHPTVHNTKQMIKRFMEDREVIMFCDLHGHSRKKNIFMYGCSTPLDPPSKLHARIFPRLLWKCSQNFSFQDCAFGIQKSKESTARVVVYKENGIKNSFTLEASFCGSDFGRNADVHFNTRHLEQMGHFLCEAILDYCDPDQTRVMTIMHELELLYSDADFLPDDTGENVGSDSDGSDDARDIGKKKGKKTKKKKKKKKKEKQQGTTGERKQSSSSGTGSSSKDKTKKSSSSSSTSSSTKIKDSSKEKSSKKSSSSSSSSQPSASEPARSSSALRRQRSSSLNSKTPMPSPLEAEKNLSRKYREAIVQLSTSDRRSLSRSDEDERAEETELRRKKQSMAYQQQAEAQAIPSIAINLLGSQSSAIISDDLDCQRLQQQQSLVFTQRPPSGQRPITPSRGRSGSGGSYGLSARSSSYQALVPSVYRADIALGVLQQAVPLSAALNANPVPSPSSAAPPTARTLERTNSNSSFPKLFEKLGSLRSSSSVNSMGITGSPVGGQLQPSFPQPFA